MLGLILGILALIGAIIMGIYFAMDKEPGASAASMERHPTRYIHGI